MKVLSKWLLIGSSMLIVVCTALYMSAQPPQYSTELTWTTPTENESREPLTDLAGFKIYCWNGSNGHTRTIRVKDAEKTGYVVDKLAAGTYNCAVVSIDSEGQESALSNIVAQTVP